MLKKKQERLPREVWIGTVSQDRMEVDSRDVLDIMIGHLEAMKVYQPDIICLPENCANHQGTAQEVPGPITNSFSDKF